MYILIALFGAGLTIEGAIKQARPKAWMEWLVDWPVAYLPEPLLKAAREYSRLSPFAIRVLGILQLLAGLSILYLTVSSQQVTSTPRRRAAGSPSSLRW